MAISLQYEKRGKKQSPSAFKKAGKIPAVFYGRKQASTSITVSAREFEKVWKKAGENTVVTLNGGFGEVATLIYTVDRHPVTDAFLHVDFYAFEKDQKLRVKVPIEFTGVAPAVKDLRGVLVKVLHDLEIEAAPKDLPRSVTVDISPLVAFDSVILAKQISLPSGVILITLPEEVTASVYEPKEEKVEETTPDISQIEVVKKGKEVLEGAVGVDVGTSVEAKETKIEQKKGKIEEKKIVEKKNK